MGRSRMGLILGSVAGLAVAVWLTVSCASSMRVGEKQCYDLHRSQPDELRYCLAQNGQGPVWAIGFGIWFVGGAFAVGYFFARAVEVSRS